MFSRLFKPRADLSRPDYARRVRWTFAILMVLGGYVFLDYTLPKYTLIHVSGTDTRRMDEDGNFIKKTGPTTGPTRDVAFIYGQLAYVEKDEAGNEKVVVDTTEDWAGINEDTGWDFPWYFKFDTADLQARASYLKDSAAYAKTYGWRFRFWSWFQNTLDLVKYEPGMTVINWVRIFVMTMYAVFVVGAWFVLHRITRGIKERMRLAAAAARERAGSIGDGFGAVGDRVGAFNSSEGVQTARRRFWKVFGNWW